MKKILLIVAVIFLPITTTAQDKTINSITRSTVTQTTKIKDKPSFSGESAGSVDKGEYFHILDYDRGYWLIDTGLFKGYISEIFLNVTPKMEKYKNRDSELNAILETATINTQLSDAAITVKYGANYIYKSIVVNAKQSTNSDSDTAFINFINTQTQAYLNVNKFKHGKNYNDELMQIIIKKNTIPHYHYTLVDWQIVAYDYNFENTGSTIFNFD